MAYAYNPGVTNDVFVPDSLIAGDYKIVTRSAVMAAGQNLARGTLLGMITSGTVTGTAGGGNTGNATIGSIAPDNNAIPGTYTLTALTSAAGVSTWSVVDPTGVNIGTATSGIPFNGGEIGFLITAGGTATAVGDTFTISVQAGTDEVTQWAPTATNGSQTPFGILADACNASAAYQECPVYVTGEFNENQITFPTGYVITEALRTTLRGLGIFLKKGMSGALDVY